MCVKNMLSRNVDITSPQTSWNVIIVYPTNSPPNVHVVDVITKGEAFQRRYFSLIPKVAINSHLPCSVTRPPACTCLRSCHVIIYTDPSTTLHCFNKQSIEGHGAGTELQIQLFLVDQLAFKQMLFQGAVHKLCQHLNSGTSW